MDWTLKDNMVNGLFCAKLTGRRGSYTPLAQTGTEASDSGAEAVTSDPGSSWEGHSEVRGTTVGDVQPLRVPLVTRPIRRTYVDIV